MDTAELRGEVALVTGATRGIGRAIAQALGGAGATVVGTATTDEGAQAIAAYPAARRTSRALAFRLDVTDAAATERVLRDVESRLGAGDDPGQQRRHHARQPAPAHEGRGVGRDHGHQPEARVPPREGGAARHDEGAPRAASSRSARWSAARATPARPTTRRPRPAWSDSPSRWRRRSAAATSPSTAWRPGFIDTDMTRALRRRAARRAARAHPAGPPRDARRHRRRRCCSWRARGRPTSPAPRCTSTAAC